MLWVSFFGVGSISGSLHLLNDDVHCIDLLLVVLGSLVALKLESWRKTVVINGEKLSRKVHLLGLLETAQLVLSGKSEHISIDCLDQVLVLDPISELALYTVLLRPLFDDGLFRDDNGDTAVLEGISVDKALCNEG